MSFGRFDSHPDCERQRRETRRGRHARRSACGSSQSSYPQARRVRAVSRGAVRVARLTQQLADEADKDAAAYVKRGLNEAGHTVDVAHSGRDGLLLAAGEVYDVIILDRLLPEVDGLTILRTIRASGVKTPVLLLTALGGIDDRVDQGCTGHGRPEGQAAGGSLSGLLVPRVGEPSEVAEAYLYLMLGAYTTGQVLRVEGGWSLSG